MATQNLLPPHVPYKNMRRFMDDLLRSPSATEPLLAVVREADGDTFAPELDAHGPGLCLAVECTELRCVALRNNILARHGYPQVAS